MKRFAVTVVLVVISLLALLATSCQKDPKRMSPTEVVEAALEAHKAKDYETFFSYCDMGPSERMLWAGLLESKGYDNQIVSYKILDCQVNGETAVVTTWIKYDDGRTTEGEAKLVKTSEGWKIEWNLFGNKEDNNVDNNVAPAIHKRKAACDDSWRNYIITYDPTNGKVVSVEGVNRSWYLSYSDDNHIIIADYIRDGNNEGQYRFTLGENGFVATFIDYRGIVFDCKYDNDGHLIQVIKGGNTISNRIWKDGNLIKYSFFLDGVERFKTQTFLHDDNLGGIFIDSHDKTDIHFWMFEVGLFGLPSKKLIEKGIWESSSKIAEYSYNFDDDGFVIKATKYYDNNQETYGYTWDVID